MEERLDIKLKKMTSQFKKDARIKECFHFNKSECSNQIVSAHSLQKSGVLDIIEENVDGNLSVFSMLNKKYSPNGIPIGFEPIGKKTASTFFGFCGYHDNELFKNIENNLVDIENDEHCFLLSYRAFAKEFHSKQESLQGFKSNEMFTTDKYQIENEGLVNGSEIGLRDCTLVKNRMNEILKNKNYDELEILTYTLDYILPIACSASINPDYSYKNKVLNKSVDTNVIYEFVNFVLQPLETGKTIILLSCLPEHKKSIEFIDQLNELKPLKFEKAISSIIIGYIENTFFSPNIWTELNKFEKNTLMSELILTTPIFRSASKDFFHSKINLIDKRFAKK